MKAKSFLVQFFLFFLLFNDISYAQEWQYISANLPESHITHLNVDESNHNNILAASYKSIYKTTDGGTKWTKLYNLKTEETDITAIYFEPCISPSTYITTNKILLEGNDDKWQEIFQFPEEDPEIINCFTVNPFNAEELLLGTSDGLYFKTKKSNTWTCLLSDLNNKNISAIKFHPNMKNLLFIASENEIYKVTFDKKTSLKYYLPKSNLPEQDFEENYTNSQFEFYPTDDNNILLLHNDKIFQSTDLGNSWNEIKKSIVNINHINTIKTSLDFNKTYLSDDNTIYTLNIINNSFQKFTSKNTLPKINTITTYEHDLNILYAGTNRGIYYCNLAYNFDENCKQTINLNLNKANNIEHLFSNEPSILELHKAAIEYAHVGNEKIKKWHRNSKLRALMPKLSIDMGQAIGNSIDLDRGSTTTDDTYIIGPDSKDFNFDMSLEWDFADILWNSNQTSIDYREKYTIEMREDILNELTSLYFERKKLKIKNYLEENDNILEKIELSIKIDELTARIDALTNGFISKFLQEQKINN